MVDEMTNQNQNNAAQPVLTEPGIQALWNEACKDSPKNPGWKRHIRFARAIEQALSKLRSPVADSTLPLEKALHELVSKIAPGLDTGDLLQDAQRASAMLDAIQARAPVADEAPTDADLDKLYRETITEGPDHDTRCWENSHRLYARAVLSRYAAPQASPVAGERAAQEYGSPADVAQRIERYLANDGRMNSGTQLLYEAMKALRSLARGSK